MHNASISLLRAHARFLGSMRARSLLAQYHNTPLLPPKYLHRLCLRFPLGHVHVPREIANNDYAKFLRGERDVL